MFKKAWVFYVVFLLVIVAYFYVGIQGFPWKRMSVAKELKHYLEQRYDEPFEKESTYYNFKDGSYGAYFHPRANEQISFSASEGWGEHPYVDLYVESTLEFQLKEDLTPTIERTFGEYEDLRVSTISYEGMRLVEKSPIPSYKEIELAIFVRVAVNAPFHNTDAEWQQVVDLLHEVQSLSPFIEVGIEFETGNSNSPFILCPAANVTKIDSVEEAKHACQLQ